MILKKSALADLVFSSCICCTNLNRRYFKLTFRAWSRMKKDQGCRVALEPTEFSFSSEKFLNGKSRVRGSVVVMKKPAVFPANFRSLVLLYFSLTL
jgi:hypothetical protein